jgi:hypothetical protein
MIENTISWCFISTSEAALSVIPAFLPCSGNYYLQTKRAEASAGRFDVVVSVTTPSVELRS